MDRITTRIPPGPTIARDGRFTHLPRADFELHPSAWWPSPKTGAKYPIRWRIAVPSLRIELDCAAAMPEQERSSREHCADVLELEAPINAETWKALV